MKKVKIITKGTQAHIEDKAGKKLFTILGTSSDNALFQAQQICYEKGWEIIQDKKIDNGGQSSELDNLSNNDSDSSIDDNNSI